MSYFVINKMFENILHLLPTSLPALAGEGMAGSALIGVMVGNIRHRDLIESALSNPMPLLRYAFKGAAFGTAIAAAIPIAEYLADCRDQREANRQFQMELSDFYKKCREKSPLIKFITESDGVVTCVWQPPSNG